MPCISLKIFFTSKQSYRPLKVYPNPNFLSLFTHVYVCMLQRTANSALPLIDLGVLNINESFIVSNLQLQRMLFLDTFSTVWCIDYTCLGYGSLQTGNLWTWIVICLDALFILRIIHWLCMTKLLISTHWYNLKVMVKFVWVNIDNLVKSSDLLKCDRFLDCSVRSKN